MVITTLTTISLIASGVLSLTTIALNVILIVAYCRMRPRIQRDMTNILLLNQTLADFSLVIPAFLWFLYLSRIMALNTYNWSLRLHTGVFFLYSVFAVHFSLMSTVIDKFVSIKYPLHPNTPSKKLKIMITLTVTWFVPILPAAMYYHLHDDMFSYKDYFRFMLTMLCLLITSVIIILATLFFTFLIIHSSIRKQNEVLTSAPLAEECNNDEELEANRRRGRSLVLFMVVLVSCYVITMLPDLIVNLVCYHLRNVEEGASCFLWTNITFVLFILYGTINPLLTIFFREDFKLVKSWLTCNVWNVTGRREEQERVNVPSEESATF